MSWKETVLEAFDVFGPASLFVLSFTEAIVQPIPPDLLYIPMLVNAMGDTPLVVWLWLVVTLPPCWAPWLDIGSASTGAPR
ncbi:MAG: hypothetical protein CM15mP78_05910 [Candidatus Poseidoniales archaeon]|nr:MAG: hypothetical protein CM15mP78_05910 [Candidatus Poseidoniales archaeon]